MKSIKILIVLFGALLSLDASSSVRIKELARIGDAHENSVLGYGLVVGLSGTGDTSRNLATIQSVSNMLREFGVNVPATGVNSRNVAAVMVTANLSAIVRIGDRFDVNVAAIGDARSLAGGTLLYTPLLGADRKTYAFAQGALTTGGYSIQQAGSRTEKNHATAGMISEGAVAEKAITPPLTNKDGTLDLVLRTPDYTTAERIANTINLHYPALAAGAVDSGTVVLHPNVTTDVQLVQQISELELLDVQPDIAARVVVNERTGTVVGGGDVTISKVSITQGDLRVEVIQRTRISQPDGLLVDPGSSIRTLAVPEATINVQEPGARTLSLPDGASIDQLVSALRGVGATPRDVIAVLQAIQRAGALHAELIIQ
ncbi:MAG: flagellar basal body P-ring protein FlgI [Steroidobacter sp.]